MAALELVVTAEQDGRDVRSLLRRELGLSAALIGRLKRTESGLTLNGMRVFTSAVVRTGDRLAVDLGAAERPTAGPGGGVVGGAPRAPHGRGAGPHGAGHFL